MPLFKCVFTIFFFIKLDTFFSCPQYDYYKYFDCKTYTVQIFIQKLKFKHLMVENYEVRKLRKSLCGL